MNRSGPSYDELMNLEWLRNRRSWMAKAFMMGDYIRFLLAGERSDTRKS